MAYTTIDDPSAHFQTGLLTGNAGLISLTNDGNSDLQPDLVWHKQRNGTQPHTMRDTSRGINKFLYTNLANAEGTNTYFTSFNSDGYTINSTDNEVNGDGDTYASWQWKANGGTRTTFSESGNNPGGGYQANTTAGFSIVDYTGTGATGTVSHGLGAVPNVIIEKGRSVGEHWRFGMFVVGTAMDATDSIKFNGENTAQDNSTYWNDTTPTSTVFTLSNGDSGMNTDAATHIAYCWTAIQGYSHFGSYVGNASADGPFIYTGFKPAMLIIKRTTTANGNWVIYDNKRDPHNETGIYLHPNENSAENDSTGLDLLSNGFKIKRTGGTWNADGDNYIYMAFAAEPFVTSTGIPATAG